MSSGSKWSGWVAGATLALVALAAAARPPERASACATAWDASSRPPQVKGEEALIVWDEARRIEHFVRSARFEGAPESFAFLVPTPSRPELAEADDGVFRRLAQLYTNAPPVSRSRSASRGVDSAGVVVVEERRVAGMDATILSATDAGALAAWLRAHGFAERAELREWLAPYVARGFFVTAFRYAAGSGDALTSTAVRLSFATDRPFYPYAEPQSGTSSPARTLRVSVIAPWRAAGREGSRPWRARTAYAARVERLDYVLGDAVPSGASGLGPWMTTFEDQPSVRGRDDLVFERAPQQDPVAASITTAISPVSALPTPPVPPPMPPPRPRAQ